MHLHPVGTININLLHLVLHASQGTLGNLLYHIFASVEYWPKFHWGCHLHLENTSQDQKRQVRDQINACGSNRQDPADEDLIL